MVAGLISHIRSAFENTLKRSTQLMLKGLFENILSAGVVDVYIVESFTLICKYLILCLLYTYIPPRPQFFGGLHRLSIVVDNH